MYTFSNVYDLLQIGSFGICAKCQYQMCCHKANFNCQDLNQAKEVEDYIFNILKSIIFITFIRVDFQVLWVPEHFDQSS